MPTPFTFSYTRLNEAMLEPLPPPSGVFSELPERIGSLRLALRKAQEQIALLDEDGYSVSKSGLEVNNIVFVNMLGELQQVVITSINPIAFRKALPSDL